MYVREKRTREEERRDKKTRDNQHAIGKVKVLLLGLVVFVGHAQSKKRASSQPNHKFLMRMIKTMPTSNDKQGSNNDGGNNGSLRPLFSGLRGKMFSMRLPSRSKLGGSITGPKERFRKSVLRSFHQEERSVLEEWSLLPDLFRQWDMSNTGFIEREELLYVTKAFCNFNNISYSPEKGQEIMAYVDDSHDERLDLEELRSFLMVFGRCVDLSPFELVYFAQGFLMDREDWMIEGKQTLLVPPRKSYKTKLEKAMVMILSGLSREEIQNGNDSYCWKDAE